MNITFRYAERQDVSLVLQFIRDLAQYEKMSDLVVADEETLEEWLGWEFQRRAKPKNNQADHLRGIADKKRGHSLSLVVDALREDPTATKAAIARKTGLSRPTVIKYYDAAKLMAGRK